MLTLTRFHQSMSRNDELNALNANFNQIEKLSADNQSEAATKSEVTTDNGWEVIYLGNRKQYRRKLTGAALTAGASVQLATSLALPDGLQMDDLYWSADIKVNGAFVNWVMGNIQATDTATTINYWIRNTGSGTSGTIVVYLVGTE